jgi:hypothetical protein
MLSEEDKIRLIHECRTALLNRMFDEFSRKPGSSAEQASDEIIATAQAARSPRLNDWEPGARSLRTGSTTVLDSFIAGA